MNLILFYALTVLNSSTLWNNEFLLNSLWIAERIGITTMTLNSTTTPTAILSTSTNISNVAIASYRGIRLNNFNCNNSKSARLHRFHRLTTTTIAVPRKRIPPTTSSFCYCRATAAVNQRCFRCRHRQCNHGASTSSSSLKTDTPHCFCSEFIDAAYANDGPAIDDDGEKLIIFSSKAASGNPRQPLTASSTLMAIREEKSDADIANQSAWHLLCVPEMPVDAESKAKSCSSPSSMTKTTLPRRRKHLRMERMNDEDCSDGMRRVLIAKGKTKTECHDDYEAIRVPTSSVSILPQVFSIWTSHWLEFNQ